MQRSTVGGRRKDPRRGKPLLKILANPSQKRNPRGGESGKKPEKWLAHGHTSAPVSGLGKLAEASGERVVRSAGYEIGCPKMGKRI